MHLPEQKLVAGLAGPLAEARADVAAGRVVRETAEAHLARLDDIA